MVKRVGEVVHPVISHMLEHDLSLQKAGVTAISEQLIYLLLTCTLKSVLLLTLN